MAMARPLESHPKRLTDAEFLHLPDDGHQYELVDGALKEAPTTVEHAALGGNVVALFKPHARGRGFVTISQAGFRMQSGNIRIPDVAFTRKERFPDGKPPKGFGETAPDLCIEIISPSKDVQDTERKVREYFDSGARLVWHLFPETQTLKVFTSPPAFKTYSAQEEIDAGDLLPGFRCPVAELFALE